MASETITRNDLTAILNEVLPVKPSEYRTLLWTNSSNTYSTGTILNNGELVGYDEVEILAAGFSTSNYVYSRCPIGDDGLIQCWTTSSDNTTNASTFMNSASRHYTTSASGGITFDNGQMTYSGNAYQNWTNRAVPLKVYGIKYNVLPAFTDLETDTLNGSFNTEVLMYKVGRIVILRLHQTTVTALNKGSWSSIGTLPAKFRPLVQTDFLAADNMATNAGIMALQVRINTDGTVLAYAFAQNATNSELMGTIAYISAS